MIGQETFAHPLAQARQTERWPDVLAVCGAGDVLVEPTAFSETYGGRCESFCRRAGLAIQESLWEVADPTSGTLRRCRGDKDGPQGAFCECSMQDRLH